MSAMTFGCRNSSDRVGILIAQLGTPDAPTKPALRRYLKQFLSDPRVIEVNRVLWWLLLNGLILQTRPKRSAKLYSRIWEPSGSPLLLISNRQRDKLREAFKDYGFSVSLGMRYGQPSMESAVDELISAGCSRIVLFPMYPQYSAPTTGSTYDAAFAALLKRRWVPTLKVVEPYYNHPAYLGAQAQIINEYLGRMQHRPEKLILSYHGIPASYVKKGDPYCCMCTETTRALKKLIDFPVDSMLQTYQSRFGKDPWLTPYADETVLELAKSGVKRLAIAAPGFTTDCLETIDELGNEAGHAFKESGGEAFDLIPCLNDHPAWIEAIKQILLSCMGDWATGERVACGNISCPAKLDSVSSAKCAN